MWFGGVVVSWLAGLPLERVVLVQALLARHATLTLPLSTQHPIQDLGGGGGGGEGVNYPWSVHVTETRIHLDLTGH